MAGDYGEINSRADFHRVLGEATGIARRLLEGSPGYEVMLRIVTELEAMKQWTEGGRQPTDDERHRIDVGLVAVRELDGAGGEWQELAQKLFALDSYFEDWPTDEQAAGSSG